MTINNEIEQLIKELNATRANHPYFLPSEIKELLPLVLTTHAELDAELEGIIITRIINRAGENARSETLAIVIKEMKHVFLRIPFWEKMGIVETYDDKDIEDLLSSCRKVNKYRNQFTHFDADKLKSIYVLNSKAKQSKRDLLRCLVKAKNDMNVYYARKIGRRRMEEFNMQKSHPIIK